MEETKCRQFCWTPCSGISKPSFQCLMFKKYSTVSQHLWTQSTVYLLRNSHICKPCALLIKYFADFRMQDRRESVFGRAIERLSRNEIYRTSFFNNGYRTSFLWTFLHLIKYYLEVLEAMKQPMEAQNLRYEALNILYLYMYITYNFNVSEMWTI